MSVDVCEYVDVCASGNVKVLINVSGVYVVWRVRCTFRILMYVNVCGGVYVDVCECVWRCIC